MRYMLIVLLLVCCGQYEGDFLGDDMANWTMKVDNVTFKEAKPGCHVYLSGDQTIPTGVGEPNIVEFDSEVYDHGGGWNTTTYTYTVPIPGVYAIS